MNMESGQSSMDLVQGFRWNHGGDRCPHMTQVRWDSAWRQSLCSCWPFPVLTHLSAYWVLTLLLCILSTLVSPVPNTSSLPDLELRLYPFSAVLSESSGTLPAQGLLLSELVPTTSAQCCLPTSSCKVEFWVIWPLMHADWLSCELCLCPCLWFSWHFVQSLSRVRLFATPWTAACQASLSSTISQSLLKLMSTESVIPSNHLVLCCPLLLPSVFPSIRVFSNESALCIRCPGAGFSSPLSGVIHLGSQPLITIKNWWPGDWWHFSFPLDTSSFISESPLSFRNDRTKLLLNKVNKLNKPMLILAFLTDCQPPTAATVGPVVDRRDWVSSFINSES